MFKNMHKKCKNCKDGYLIENEYGIFCSLCGFCVKEKKKKKWWVEENPPFGVRFDKKKKVSFSFFKV